jgi:outer membrane receptor protein involved in Fe transport
MSNGTLVAQMYTYTQKVDPNLKPAINPSYEFGFDLKFFQNRLGLDFTYYNEKRNDEIIGVSMSRATGYSSSLINAGESERSGVEVVVTGTPVKTRNFNWDIVVNWAKNNTKINELPGDLDAITAPGGTVAFGFVSMYHSLGDNWGNYVVLQLHVMKMEIL